MNAASARHVRQDIIGLDGQAMGRELLTRSNSPSERPVPQVLSQALLDGGAGGRPGLPIFITLDHVDLFTPVVEVFVNGLGVVQLPRALPLTRALERRLAILTEQGLSFALGGVSRVDDPRWALAAQVRHVMVQTSRLPVDQREPLMALATQWQHQVIAQEVETAAEYEGMRRLGVTAFQGPYCHDPQARETRLLPGCNPTLLQRLARLMVFGVSCDVLAREALADPALLLRLPLLHALYCPGRAGRVGSLAGLLSDLPFSALQGWISTLAQSSCHGRNAEWVRVVQQRMNGSAAALPWCGPPPGVSATGREAWQRLQRLDLPGASE